MSKNKYAVRILKALPGLTKGTEKTLDKRVAVDMVEGGKAEFVNSEDADELKESKKEVAKHSKNAMKKTTSSRGKLQKADADLSKKAKDQEELKRERAINLAYGRRKKQLDKFDEFIDNRKKEFQLSKETTSEEWQKMLALAQASKSESEESEVEKQKNADAYESRKTELSGFGEFANVDALTKETTQEEFKTLIATATEAKQAAEEEAAEDGENSPEEDVKDAPKSKTEAATKKGAKK
jgi:hypothetical protein